MRRAYRNDIVERDVRERVGARSSLPLRRLAQMLFESAGSELSVRRVAAALGMAADTASLYLEAMESAYFAFACRLFDEELTCVRMTACIAAERDLPDALRDEAIRLATERSDDLYALSI